MPVKCFFKRCKRKNWGNIFCVIRKGDPNDSNGKPEIEGTRKELSGAQRETGKVVMADYVTEIRL